MQRFLKFIFSGRMLAILAALLLALAVWFVGPLLAFGGLRPLESIGMRVTVILLLAALLFLWLRSWPLGIVGVVALCLLIWQATPLLTFNELKPFEPVGVRVALIAIILLVSALYGLYRLWQALRIDEDLLKKVLHPRGDRPVAEARKELHTVNTIITRSIAQLKQMGSGAFGIRRLFEGKRYLYELPWYMIIGAPGDGKTTALLNAGLHFPLAEQMGMAAQSMAGQEGGSQYCDWWFTNEAVLIDTAGRYARHDKGGSLGTTHANAEEWMGFLGLLRKYRPRAPINGMLLTLNVADLLNKPETERIEAAAALRGRLAEARSRLGIRFPVYMVLTKMDLLPGFTDYFSSLTSEGRAQVWGFTLPYDRKQKKTEALRPYCENELKLLAKRLEQGITNRLQEEYDVQGRCRLYALPQEFAALAEPLLDIIDRIFLDSRYDNTQLHNTLRGVYFTSATQVQGKAAVADKLAPLNRFWRAVRLDPALTETTSHNAATLAPTGNRSYFLHELLTKLVFRESHLVQPNLQWEWRYRLLRLAGHFLVLVLFIGFLQGMRVSYGNNNEYLSAVSSKTAALMEKVRAYSSRPSAEAVPGILNDARALANYPGLTPGSPPTNYRYGLYSAPPVLDSVEATYDRLLDQLLLPPLIRQVESALFSAVARQDNTAAYDALRVYLLLHLDEAHKAKFNGEEIQAWVLKDWDQNDSALAFGGRGAIIEHVHALFDGRRVLHSPFPKNEQLIREARTFLGGHTSVERIYERAKIAMKEEAPEDFTLTRAVGSDAGMAFMRASGEPLDQGIPGLFTLSGYRDLLDKRLGDFVSSAEADDNWVMGLNTAGQKKTAARQLAQRAGGADPLSQEVRRLYLAEYATRWQAFLEDIHSVNSTGADTGSSLAFDLQTLRVFTSPDSPLARLARAIVAETTLVPPLDPKEKQKTLDERAESRLSSGPLRAGVQTARLLNDAHPEEQTERNMVDNRFAALREVVNGQADNQNSYPGGRPLRLDSLLGMINEYYNQLMVADNALATMSLPTPIQASAKLRLEAAKLPAPLKNILLDLTTQGAGKINQASGEVLQRQMEAIIGNSCRNAIDGRYPFTSSSQEVSAEDFNRIFAAGGVLDSFFTKQLAPQVDVTSQPWCYKQTDSGVPPIQGPELAPFQQAQRIREALFKDPGANKMSLSMEINVVELDPNITDLIIDIDGQALRYVHGPLRPLHVNWPGPRNGSMAEITANPRIRQDTSTILTNGPWALFRLLDKGHLVSTASSNRQLVEYNFDGRRAVLEITTGSDFNPLGSTLLSSFSCPARGGL